MSVAKSSGARILVVEDQDDVRRMLVTALEIEGHEVADAANAADATRRDAMRRDATDAIRGRDPSRSKETQKRR